MEVQILKQRKAWWEANSSSGGGGLDPDYDYHVELR